MNSFLCSLTTMPEDVCARICLLTTGEMSLAHLKLKGKIIGLNEVIGMDFKVACAMV